MIMVIFDCFLGILSIFFVALAWRVSEPRGSTHDGVARSANLQRLQINGLPRLIKARA